MKRKLLVAAIAATMLAPVVASAADVTMGGRVRVNLSQSDVDGADGMLINENKARLRAQAAETTDGGTKVIAQLEVEFANNHGATGGATPDLRSARILFINDMGTFVFAGDTPSGYFSDLYGHLDQFQSASMGDTDELFDQSAESGNLAAYANKFGPVKFVAAWVIPSNSNEEEPDVLSLRGIWTSGPMQIGLGHNIFAENFGDRTITTLMAGFDAGVAKLGLTAEQVSREATDADSTTMGFSVNAPVGDKVTLQLTAVSLSKDDSSPLALGDGAQRTIIGAEYAVAPGVTSYANYTTDNEDGTDSAIINIGTNFSF